MYSNTTIGGINYHSELMKPMFLLLEITSDKNQVSKPIIIHLL